MDGIPQDDGRLLDTLLRIEQKAARSPRLRFVPSFFDLRESSEPSGSDADRAETGHLASSDTVTFLEEALRSVPTRLHVRARILRALALLHLCREDRRSVGTVREYAARAVELTQWRDPRAIAVLAESHLASGDPESASRILRRALSLPPVTDGDRREGPSVPRSR